MRGRGAAAGGRGGAAIPQWRAPSARDGATHCARSRAAPADPSPPPPRARALPAHPQVDAAGTLLIPSEPVTEVYLRAAARHGVAGLSEREVLDNFRRCAAALGGRLWVGGAGGIKQIAEAAGSGRGRQRQRPQRRR
jgi:hypothetical protein